MTDFSGRIAEGWGERALDIHMRKLGVSGDKPYLPMFYRYVVIDTIFDPSIIDKDKIDTWKHIVGVSNMDEAAVLPRNTIIGKRIIDGSSTSAEAPMFLLPFFPSHLSFPCKPGEHVWVMFEAPGVVERTVGYWFCKITELGYIDDVNHQHAPRRFDPSFTPKIKDLFNGTGAPIYEYRNGQPRELDNERYTVAETALIGGGDEEAYEKLISNSDGSQIHKYEKIPRYRKRPGDMAFEGSNNTLIVLGTDRAGAAADLKKKIDPVRGAIPSKFEKDMDGEAGSIDLVAGRGQTEETGGKEVKSKRIADKSDFNTELGKTTAELVEKEGDPDLKADRSRVLIVQRTMVDKNLGIDSFNTDNFGDGIGDPDSAVADPSKGCGAIVIKSDKVRIIARMDVEILVSGFESDTKGAVKSLEDPEKYAAIVLRSNGDIIIRPSKDGYVKLGGDDASLAVLCQDNAVTDQGKVTAIPIIDSMGGQQGTGTSGQGQYSTKVLMKLCQQRIKIRTKVLVHNTLPEYWAKIQLLVKLF